MLPQEAANIHPEKHNILVFLSNTLFSPFYVPSPSLFPISKNGRYLGGTWEERFRFTFATSLLSYRCQSEVLSKSKRSSIEDKAKFYRRQSEVLSKIKRRPIEHLSKTYRRPIEESMCQLFYPPPQGLSVASKNGHIAKYLLFDT